MKLLINLLICSILAVVFTQRPRIPSGYEIVESVRAEGELADRPPQEAALMARGFGDGGRDCFWIKFCRGRGWFRERQCFWLKVCSTGDDNGRSPFK